MEQLKIIKIGGNIIDDPGAQALFLAQFAAVKAPKVLVHGGGKIATAIGTKLGIVPDYVQGRRVTDAETLDLVTMVYGGLINKRLVAQLQAIGCNALGLCGADGNVVLSARRPVKETDYGFVGDVMPGGVSVTLLGQLLDAGITPVMAPLTHDGRGQILNTNADTIAQETARAMAAGYEVQLIFCFDKPGVLLDAADDSSVIPRLDEKGFRELLGSGAIHEGMVPKLENALRAIRSGVRAVTIGDARSLQTLIDHQSGTTIL